MYVRIHLVKSFGIDDAMMIVALVCATFKLKSCVVS